MRKISPAEKQRREVARKIITAKVEFYCAEHGFEYNRTAIRNQKTRWGSCSSKKNLNFNVKLLHLREELIDYVVVHELAHTVHLNHSHDFWAVVAEVFPHYKDLRKELRKIHVV